MTEETKPFAAQIQALRPEVVGITSSPSTTLEIAVDITEKSKTSRALGQMVHVILPEDDKSILAVGQIVGLQTRNRWHEDMAFKGVIKRHGALPHLSGVADNRLATVSVQSCFDLSGATPIDHILGVSPSTGEPVNKMNNQVMSKLVAHQEGVITRIGRVYGTDVDMPMRFRHFGKDDGADTYHIGVFGKTGSGKTTAAALMLLGYARNRDHMNILVLDPKRQFMLDHELLPSEKRLKDEIQRAGMNCRSLDLVSDVYLPAEPRLLADLVLANGFVRSAFQLTDEGKRFAVSERIDAYFSGRCERPDFQLHEQDARKMLLDMLRNFGKKGKDDKFSDDVKHVYSQTNYRERLRDRIDALASQLNDPSARPDFLKKWGDAFSLFTRKKIGREQKASMDEVVRNIVSSKGGEFIVLALGRDSDNRENENLQALFLQRIERKIAEEGEAMYAQGKRANCLVVMDEAHRFVAGKSPDARVRELTRDIVDSVRTTRKYGIGHMFITQTLESMDDEILKQMSVFAFGHGLTTGAELRKVGEIVNSKTSVDLYKSFIDPRAVNRFPFMFFGPVSPFSATNSPLFIETYTNFALFEAKNKGLFERKKAGKIAD